VFTEQKVMFIYAVSPLHMGAGTGVGLIDNPIQREVHTDWPSMAGSGIKGAVRHALSGKSEWKNGNLTRIFGPEPGPSLTLHAGAVSFTDAQIVCFPVRSIKRAYVYATCPTALARMQRLTNADWSVPQVKETEALIANDDLKQDTHLVLEALVFDATKHESVSAIATDLAGKALPKGFFANKLMSDLVILSDTDFTYFVKNSTLVEPHVRIEDTTGTADGGGLFYTENLPPECLLVSLLMASGTRTGKQEMPADKVIDEIDSALGIDQVWQFGGDATTGRGLVMLKLADCRRAP
jgi:CRISPR-associated protein Cmr4